MDSGHNVMGVDPLACRTAHASSCGRLAGLVTDDASCLSQHLEKVTCEFSSAPSCEGVTKGLLVAGDRLRENGNDLARTRMALVARGRHFGHEPTRLTGMKTSSDWIYEEHSGAPEAG